VHYLVHNIAQNSSDNLRFIIQTIIVAAELVSTGGEEEGGGREGLERVSAIAAGDLLILISK